MMSLRRSEKTEEKTMKRANSLLLPGCCLVLNFLFRVQCEENQQYGDVTFNCPMRQDENHADGIQLRGKVSITYGNSSIPLTPFYVCYNYDDPYQSFNRGAAAAVCRQKGFVDAEVVDTNLMKYCGTPHMIGCSEKSDEKVPGQFISHIICPNVSDYARYGELHVMRCSVGEIVDSTCAPVSVICSSRKLDDNSYNGMIIDPGRVKIHLFDSAKYICFPNNTDMDKDAIGSSVCRQIGYTSASSVSPSDWPRDGESAYQFSSLNCNSETGSYQCFSHCINQTEVTTSSDCQYVLSVACSYDSSVDELMTSGSPSVCLLQVSTNASTSSPYYISTIVLGAVLGVENIPICFLCTVCLFTCLRRRGWCHRPLNDHNDRNDRNDHNDQNLPNAGEHLVLLRNNNNDGRQQQD